MKIKSAAIFTIALCSSLAIAKPSIGDMATFNVIVKNQGETNVVTLGQTITSFNESTRQWAVSETVNANSTEVMRAEDELLGRDEIQGILENCVAYEGALESIQVPAGTFNACKLNIGAEGQPSYAWIGEVGLGVIKFDISDNQGNQSVGQLTEHVLK